MFCNKCKTWIADDSSFCRFCGESQTEANAASPRKKADWQDNLVKVLLGVLGLFMLLALVATCSSQQPHEMTAEEKAADALADEMEKQADALDAMSDAQTPKVTGTTKNWEYSIDTDKVRGGTSHFASTTSTNAIMQSPPYDPETRMRMTVRRMPAHGMDVILTITSGQMMCPSYNGCSGTVRFDDGSAQTIRFNGPADGSSETVFVDGAKPFIAKLRKARRVIIEKTIYQAGAPQFEFDVSGLKWDH